MSSKGLNIVLRAVDKTFKKGAEQIQVLRQLDLEIVAGESLTILGASGVGKSTLLYLIGTLEHPDGGELLIDGKSIFTQPLSQLAAFRNLHMGFIFQFHHLLKDFDAQENVAMPLLVRGVARRLAMDKAAEMLQQVGLGKRLNHRSGELSGGEQQRVAIARAMINQPQLLLADEPTGNLDRANAEQIQNLLLNLNQQHACTLIVVTHNDTFVKKTQRTVWLHDGKITHSSPVA